MFIYTGNRKTRREYLYLSKEFFDGDDSVLDVFISGYQSMLIGRKAVFAERARIEHRL
jgi:hypothetical protein